MEDTVVRNVRLTSIAAVLVIVGVAAQAVPANPATSWWGGQTTTAAPTIQTVPQANVTAEPVLPSSQIDPANHPLKYFMAAMSELPVVSTLSGGTQPGSRYAASRPDAISLQTPTGPPTPELCMSVAQLAERQGNIEQARHQFKQALAMWPDNVDVLRAAARMEDRAGHLDWAEYLYQRAATANPHHAGTLNDLGLCLARQGKLEQSVQTIEQAIHLQPDKALYRNNVATVLVELRQDQKALAHLTAVHAPGEASYNMGQLLLRRGRTDEAEEYLVAALQQDPELQEAQAALAALRGEPMPVAKETVATRESDPPTTPIAVEQGPQFTPQPEYQPTAQMPVAPTPVYPTYLPPTYQRAPSTSYGIPAGTPVGVLPRHLPPVGIVGTR